LRLSLIDCIRRPALLAAQSLVVLLLLSSAFVSATGTINADTPISITTQPAVKNNFPDELVFTVSAKDSAQITDVVLHYSLLPEGDNVNARADFSKGTDVQATYHMRSNGNPLYLPPGKEIRYSWQFTDANGAQLTTDPATVTYTDTRFDWQKVNSGNLTLYFYRGSTSDANSLLNVGAMSISKASQLEQTQLNFPVKLFAYATQSDFLKAAQKESKATDPGLLGQALTPDTVIFIAPSLRSSETQDTVRHELTHLVTGAAVQGGFQNLMPLWLNEGTSVYAQADPGDYASALQAAIRQNSVVPIQVLESSRGVDVGLFYGESYALVKFLIDTGGPSKFSQLLAAIKGGKSIDQALQASYGFDRTGLYNAWRDSVHLSGPGASAAGAAASAPTAAPSSESGQPDTNATPEPGPSRGSQGSEVTDSGTTVLLLTVGGALLLMLVAAVVAFALVLARRSRSY
jgi:Peptidase MA superfamily